MHASMRVADAQPVLERLHVVVEHLSSTDGNEQLYKTVGRALHRSSKHGQASARATMRHLSLERYYQQINANVPWDTLEAFPAVTSLSLDPHQLALLAHNRDDPTIKAMLAQLKRLKVCNGAAFHPVKVPPHAVGQLLWACWRLEEVDLCVGTDVQQPWLLLDPNSTSTSAAVGPPLPLRSLVLQHMPGQLVAGWMQQQQRQLGRTLQRLEVDKGLREGGALDVGQLTGLVALRDLKLSWTHISASTHLGTMSSLSQLHMSGSGCTTAAVEAVCTLPNLQHLSVAGGWLRGLPDAMCALKQLTCLDISNNTGIEQLPDNLGLGCTGLVRLKASETPLAAVPASLASLTCLEVCHSCAPQLVLPTTLTRLKELYLAFAKYDVISGISSLVGLEQLEAVDFEGDMFDEQGMAALLPLTRLTHLNLQGITVQAPGSFTAIGALQQLTNLDLSDVMQRDNGQWTTAGWAALARAEPPPALQYLDLRWCFPEHGMSVLAPWLSRLTALTQLNMSCNTGGNGDELLYLPPQLEQLNLSSMELQRVPQGLLQLSALQVLNLSNNPALRQVPAWCSRLCSLAVLLLDRTGVVTQQLVLARMPALKTLWVPYQAAVCDAELPGVLVLRL